MRLKALSVHHAWSPTGYDLGPDARPLPANEAIVASSVGTKTVRQVPPSRAGPRHPKDAVEDTAVVHPCYATPLVRQHRLDGSPFVGQFIAHDSKLPSLGARSEPTSTRLVPVAPSFRFRGEANMNWQARLAGSVENDPWRSSAGEGKPSANHSIIRTVERSRCRTFRRHIKPGTRGY